MSLSALPPKKRTRTASKGLVRKGMLQDKCSSSIENHELYYLTTDRKLLCNHSKSVVSAMIIQRPVIMCWFKNQKYVQN